MSTLNVSNITDGTTTVGTSYVVNGSAKAWVNFFGGTPISIRNSFNTSSLTDNGIGDYLTNYTTAFRQPTMYVLQPHIRNQEVTLWHGLTMLALM